MSPLSDSLQSASIPYDQNLMSFWKNMTEKNGFYSIDEALNLGMISQNTTYNNSNKVENFSYNGSSYFGQVSNAR